MQLLTADEIIAKYFGNSRKISTDKLYRLAKKGEFPSLKLDGRVFFPDNEIEEWIRRKTKILEPYGRSQKNTNGIRVVNE